MAAPELRALREVGVVRWRKPGWAEPTGGRGRSVKNRNPAGKVSCKNGSVNAERG